MTCISLPLLTPPGDLDPAPRTNTSDHLADRFGRGIGYLRLSLTRGCAMRCLYCRPAIDRNPQNEARLTPSEIQSVASHLATHHGLKKIRLTGGDPTSRPQLIDIIQRLAIIPGIDDLAMTTNGLTLARQSQRYADAGLHRVNVSLDTLDPARFHTLTGVDGLGQVLQGIDAAQAAGLVVKLNTVVVKGHNEQDLPELLHFAAERDLALRFIELMPMGPLAESWEQRYVPESAMRRLLAPHVQRYDPLPQGRSAARSYRVTLNNSQQLTLGFITPMSCNFCEDCDRLRLDAAGNIYPCLMDEPRGSLVKALRPNFDAALFDQRLIDAYSDKAPTHPAVGPATMTHIGG